MSYLPSKFYFNEIDRELDITAYLADLVAVEDPTGGYTLHSQIHLVLASEGVYRWLLQVTLIDKTAPDPAASDNTVQSFTAGTSLEGLQAAVDASIVAVEGPSGLGDDVPLIFPPVILLTYDEETRQISFTASVNAGYAVGEGPCPTFTDLDTLRLSAGSNMDVAVLTTVEGARIGHYLYHDDTSSWLPMGLFDFTNVGTDVALGAANIITRLGSAPTFTIGSGFVTTPGDMAELELFDPVGRDYISMTTITAVDYSVVAPVSPTVGEQDVVWHGLSFDNDVMTGSGIGYLESASSWKSTMRMLRGSDYAALSFSYLTLNTSAPVVDGAYTSFSHFYEDLSTTYDNSIYTALGSNQRDGDGAGYDSNTDDSLFGSADSIRGIAFGIHKLGSTGHLTSAALGKLSFIFVTRP